jgi:hypothetical protein
LKCCCFRINGDVQQGREEQRVLPLLQQILSPVGCVLPESNTRLLFNMFLLQPPWGCGQHWCELSWWHAGFNCEGSGWFLHADMNWLRHTEPSACVELKGQSKPFLSIQLLTDGYPPVLGFFHYLQINVTISAKFLKYATHNDCIL